MKKNEFVELLNEIGVPVHEGITPQKDSKIYPRIDFWDYVWDYQVASGGAYMDVQTYQVSFYSKTPRHHKLLELRNIMLEKGIMPSIYHEFVEAEKVHHSYFSVDLCV